MLYSIVGILVIILDQAVKFWVSDTLFGTDVVRFIPGVISLVNVHNDGAAFGFLSGQGARIYFIIATGVFVILVIIALATNFIRGKLSRWCLVLVAAGGLGLLDGMAQRRAHILEAVRSHGHAETRAADEHAKIDIPLRDGERHVIRVVRVVAGFRIEASLVFAALERGHKSGLEFKSAVIGTDGNLHEW